MNWYLEGSAFIPFEMNQSNSILRVYNLGFENMQRRSIHASVTGTQMAALADGEGVSALCVFN